MRDWLISVLFGDWQPPPDTNAREFRGVLEVVEINGTAPYVGRRSDHLRASCRLGSVLAGRGRIDALKLLLSFFAVDIHTFTICEDHMRQEQFWEALSLSYDWDAEQIRQMLTQKSVRASDPRAIFVGLDAYHAAGGVVLNDLFTDDRGGWPQDVGVLDRPAGEKLKHEAETLSVEG